MNPAIQLLLMQTLATSSAVLLVTLLRCPLARWFDDRAVYLAWLCVPVALLAALLPSPPAVTPLVAVDALAAAPAVMSAGQAPAAPQATAPWLWANAGLTLWLAGAGLMALAMAAQQRRFNRQMQPTADGGPWQLPAGSSACVVGVRRPRLALPADFHERFTAEERELILAHEAVHLRRHDNLWNLLAAACYCLQWFNPLAWWGWRRMRADQELACDAVVLIERQPDAELARYAQALVRSHEQAAQALLPTLASPWRPQAGLVERVARLDAHARRRGARRHDRAWMAGLILTTAATVSATTALHTPRQLKALEDGQGPAIAGDAAPLMAPTTLRWRMDIREDGKAVEGPVSSLLLMHGRSPAGNTSKYVSSDASGPLWCFEVTGNRFEDGSWRVSGFLLDAQCKSPLAESRPLTLDGSPQTFHGRLANGKSLDVEITARRFMLPEQTVWLDVGLSHNLKASAPAGLRLLGPAGQPLRVKARATPDTDGAASDALDVELVTTATAQGHARIQARLLLGEPARLLAEPQVITRWDEPARIRWDDATTGRFVELRVTPHHNALQAH